MKLIKFLLFFVSINLSLSETLGKITIMESKNLSIKYADLFVSKKYKNPSISLEPLGKTEWLDSVELVKVLNNPAPPADPVPYDLWVIVKGQHLFLNSDLNSIYNSIEQKIESDKDALKVAQTLIYIHSARAYYHEDMIDSDKNSVESKNGEWLIKQFTASAATKNSIFDNVQRMNSYEIFLGKGYCKIK